jgi:hypothetical protein
MEIGDCILRKPQLTRLGSSTRMSVSSVSRIKPRGPKGTPIMCESSLTQLISCLRIRISRESCSQYVSNRNGEYTWAASLPPDPAAFSSRGGRKRRQRPCGRTTDSSCDLADRDRDESETADHRPDRLQQHCPGLSPFLTKLLTRLSQRQR